MSTDHIERELNLFRTEREAVYEVRLTQATGPTEWRLVAWSGDSTTTLFRRPTQAECIALRDVKIAEEVADLRRTLERASQRNPDGMQFSDE
jgi:hypothetical protein